MGSPVGMAAPRLVGCQTLPCVEATGHWWLELCHRAADSEPLRAQGWCWLTGWQSQVLGFVFLDPGVLHLLSAC